MKGIPTREKTIVHMSDGEAMHTKIELSDLFVYLDRDKAKEENTFSIKRIKSRWPNLVKLFYTL